MARTAESSYNSRLRQVAKQIDVIVKGLSPDGFADTDNILKALRWYAELLKPWATSVASYMVADVARRNERAWRQSGNDISKAIQSEILYAPTGHLFTGLMNDQVELITSLPLDAAKRVHEITTEAMSTTGIRAEAISKKILATGEVTAARARLIARTEVARTASSFTQARARFAGSLGYIWRTSKDADVRPTHQAMNGIYVDWDKPPKTDKGLDPYHAGCGPNCFTGDVGLDLNNGCFTLWRMFYDGELIDFIAGGVAFSVTPNHPILTKDGWVAAGLIQDGDQVLTIPQEQVKIIEANEDDKIPSFEELFVTLTGDTEGTVLRALPFNFHGDVFDHEVNQIALKWLLSGDPESMIHQELCNFLLTDPYHGIPWSQVLHIKEPGVAGIRNLLTSLFQRLAGHCQSISLRSVANGNSQTGQEFIDGERRCQVLLGKCASSDSTQILSFYRSFRKISASIVRRSSAARDSVSPLFKLDAQSISAAANNDSSVFNEGSVIQQDFRVIQKTRREFTGHVFTIESSVGWFGITAAGIISKNCRCYPDPVLPDL